MRVAIKTVLLALTAMLPDPAFAQLAGAGTSAESQRYARDRTNANGFLGEISDLRPDRDTPQSMDTYLQMLDYGRCTSAIGRRTVKSALAEQPNSISERTQIRLIGDRLFSCRGNGVSRIASLQRGSLAEGYYKKMAVKPGALVALPPDTPEYSKFISGERAFSRMRESDDMPLAMATTCLVAQQPSLAATTLSTRHGSPEEVAVMDRLFAAAPGCAGAVRPARLSRSFLRAFLADAMLRFATFRSDNGNAWS